jgi:ATP-dependent DNA ligase
MEDAEKSLEKGAFKFRLSGEKLKGGWMLARLKPKADDEKINWLLFKERDQAANTTGDILTDRPESVKSGRHIEELVTKPRAAAKRVAPKPGKVPGAVKAAMPSRIEPQLATAVAHPPSGDDWLHEIKFDGYRTAVHVVNGTATFVTRSGLDWTKRYGTLKAAFAKLPCATAIIDGEIVVTDDKGISRFAGLQGALANGETHRLTFYAFDLLYLDGWGLTGVRLDKRKELLGQLLAGAVTSKSALQFSDHVGSDGEALYERASEMGLEGIVSKRAATPYESGRSKTWTKAKRGRSAILSLPVTPFQKRRRGWRRWRWPNGSTASWNIAANVVRASTPKRCRCSLGGCERLKAVRSGSKVCRGKLLPSARCLPPISTIRTARLTTRYDMPSSRDCGKLNCRPTRQGSAND